MPQIHSSDSQTQHCVFYTQALHAAARDMDFRSWKDEVIDCDLGDS